MIHNNLNILNDAGKNAKKMSKHRNIKINFRPVIAVIICLLFLFSTSSCTFAKNSSSITIYDKANNINSKESAQSDSQLINSSPSAAVDNETVHTNNYDSTSSNPQVYIEWQESTYRDDNDYPYNDISLKLTGSINEEIFITTIQGGDLSKVQRRFTSEFPEDAILPVYSFYAGGMDFLYIKNKDSTSISVMYKLEYDEFEESSEFKEIAVIKIPNNCTLIYGSVEESAYNKSIFSPINYNNNTISAGYNFTIGINTDHNVLAVGDNEYGQLNVNNWNDIISVDAGYKHSVGLKSDGTVIATGSNAYGQCDVSDWSDIIAISVGAYHTAGLLSDGTVVAVGKNDYGQIDVGTWTDIVQVSASGNNTLGLKADGTVIGAGSNEFGQINFNSWNNIIAVSAGKKHSTGLTENGDVLAVGSNEFGQCNTNKWSNIVAIVNGGGHSVGLASNGTVKAVGLDYQDRCDVNGWMNIVAIEAGYAHTIGLKKDGTIVSVGWNESGQCDTDKWQNIIAE